jgi:tyrosine-protein phosphatase non-receptor type 23
VKALGFDPLDPTISGPDLFATLVPLDIHKANSLYSEEKAKLLRRIADMVNDRDEELKYVRHVHVHISHNCCSVFMASLDVNELHINDDKSRMANRIPDELLKCHRAFQSKTDAMPQLLDSLQRISNIFHVTVS